MLLNFYIDVNIPSRNKIDVNKILYRNIFKKYCYLYIFFWSVGKLASTSRNAHTQTDKHKFDTPEGLNPATGASCLAEIPLRYQRE